jgi:beta-glucosidase
MLFSYWRVNMKTAKQKSDRISVRKVVVFALTWFLSFLPALAQEPKEPAYKDPQLSVEQRAKDLVSRMTLREKASQLGHAADAIPRLDVPQYDWWNEGLHGVARAGNATVFPQAIGLAATFDEPLMHRIADVISTEFRAKYVERMRPDGSTDQYRGLTVWSPNINIFRDPRWGRGQETYGEDPYLTSRLGLAFVTGLQGNNAKYLKTVATPKHFAVHSGPESTRHTVDVKASKHDMNDTYLPAFRVTVMDGKAESVMCAYNSVNGQPACANEDLLKKYLRGAWGFKGYVVSDCAAIADVFSGHHYSKTIEEAAAVSFKVGTDLVCGWPTDDRVKFEKDALENAVLKKLMPEAVLDQALVRLFSARFRLGMFDPPSMVPWSKITAAQNDTDEHRQLSLKAARESIVLLKNNGLLPLKKEYETIAVIGPNADDFDALVGNYNGTPSKPVTVLAGIKNRFPNSTVIYAQGTGLTGPAMEPVPTDHLFTSEDKKDHGLKSDYYSNSEFKGSPKISRTDKDVNFEWGDAGVSSEMARNFSVRWQGVLVPPTTGDYLVGFSGEDGYRVWLDNNLIAEDWTPHRPATTVRKQIHLQAGRPYPLRIEYSQLRRGAEARLVWSVVGRAEQEAIDAARKADLVVVAMGLSPRIEGEEMKVDAEGFLGGDRTKIDLPGPQQKLLERLHAEGKPVVLVLMGGSAIAANWADEKIPAILNAWYPGGEGGTAVAEVLAGDYSPSGRLPVTFYRSVDQLPPFEDYSMAKRTYRYFPEEVLYPFGYGLSYTSFQYSNAKVDRANVPADGNVSVSVDVENTGKMPSDEVVQLYLTHRGIPGAPLRTLQGFKRIHLAPSQKTTVTFQLENRQLSIVDGAGNRRITPSDVDVWIGGGQPDVRAGSIKTAGARTVFKITGQAVLPD